MAVYHDARCRLCRREGMKLFLKGDRCYTDKCAIERRNYPPGQHGQGRRRKVSEYAVQLREKQRLKRMYGLMESQFRKYFEMRKRHGIRPALSGFYHEQIYADVEKKNWELSQRRASRAAQ